MATKEYWVQIEERGWDVHPWPVAQPGAGAAHMAPSGLVALVVRRYTEGWGQPIDEPVNPWDLLEPEPGQTGGTMPGAVIGAKVGDDLIVHFRNMDARAGVPVLERTHSLHPHGVQRAALHDGAYPLSPPDPAQGGARGDRVRPGERFTYRWSVPHRSTSAAAYQ